VQVDSPIQKRLSGVGLGLALSKKFAELLGGKVAVQSEPDVGSTFWVEIPVSLADNTRTESIQEDFLDSGSGDGNVE
jgi:signal transduction histidine kinase